MSEFWTILLTLLIGVLIIWYYGCRNLKYFKKRGIPCDPPLPFLGNMAETVFRVRSFREKLDDVYNSYQDMKYVGFFDFQCPVILIRDPGLIKTLTVKSFDNFPDHKMLAEEILDEIFTKNLFATKGQQWKDLRALLSPSFTSSKMKIIFKLIKESTSNLIDNLKARSLESNEFGMRDVLARHTNDMIMTSAFGISVNSLKDKDNDFFITGKKTIDFNGERSLKFFFLRTFPTLSKLLNVRLWNKKTVKFYKDIVQTTIAIRDAKGIVRPDMLQLMMQARDGSKSLELTTDDMTAHAFIFYFGGFETISLVMCFLVHEVAVNQEVHKKLQAEVDEVLEECAGDVSYEALHAMSYLDNVVNETLRLHAPAPMIDRLCRQSFELPPAQPGLKPFLVPPGMSLWMPLDAIHRDAKYHENPEKFDPDRFSEERKSNIDPATFFPFGKGPRTCIGNRFAIMELKLVIFELLANFNITTCSRTINPIQLSRASFVTYIEGGAWLKLEPRN